MSKKSEEQAGRVGRLISGESVPPHSPGLEARIMQRIADVEAAGERAPSWRRPVARWSAAAALLVVGIAAYLMLLERPHLGNIPAAGMIEARFVYPDLKAESVLIAGDFTDWQKVAMERRESGWSFRLPLQAGETYRYVFLVDGACVEDPAATVVVKDDFGCDNNLISL